MLDVGLEDSAGEADETHSPESKSMGSCLGTSISGAATGENSCCTIRWGLSSSITRVDSTGVEYERSEEEPGGVAEDW